MFLNIVTEINKLFDKHLYVVKISKQVMLPAHFNNAASDLFTIMEKFWDCPKFW